MWTPMQGFMRTAAALALISCVLATATAAGFNMTTISFDEGFVHLFGGDNLVRSVDGRSVQLLLTRQTGSGFISSSMYSHGLFSALIKLPSDYTAGVVVAFYTSNGDVFAKTHDEVDFEFLGNRRGEEWRVQTNVYGNGSTSRGREERYHIPFDPTVEPHRYSILWTTTSIIFYIDNTPIREVKRSEGMGGDFPSKPMSLYATIWDGSTWATNHGKYGVDYKYSPFVSEFSDFILRGCRSYPIEQLPEAHQCEEEENEAVAYDNMVITRRDRRAMDRFRERYMSYSYCYDRYRYSVPFPECEILPSQQERIDDSGNLKPHLRRRRSKHRTRTISTSTSTSRNKPDM